MANYRGVRPLSAPRLHSTISPKTEPGACSQAKSLWTDTSRTNYRRKKSKLELNIGNQIHLVPLLLVWSKRLIWCSNMRLKTPQGRAKQWCQHWQMPSTSGRAIPSWYEFVVFIGNEGRPTSRLRVPLYRFYFDLSYLRVLVWGSIQTN